jgi:hypothetical protein
MYTCVENIYIGKVYTLLEVRTRQNTIIPVMHASTM